MYMNLLEVCTILDRACDYSIREGVGNISKVTDRW